MKGLFVTLSRMTFSINDNLPNNTKAIMLSVIMLNVIMLSVVMLNVCILSVIMLNVVILSVVVHK